MLYQVSRNGQIYGPYTLYDLERYVATGNVLPTDLCKSEGMAEWLAVAQVLGSVPPGTQPGFAPASAGGSYGPPATPVDTHAYPDPPNLAWPLVLLFSVLTCGLFMIVWNIVVAVWVRRIQPASNALYLYIAGAALRLINSGTTFGILAAAGRHHYYRSVRHPGALLLGLAGYALVLVALFSVKAFLEDQFNRIEPIGLRLSGFMTFLFGGLYLQYHLNRIAEIKSVIRYRGMAR